jgi:hypothetical protein
MGWFLIFAATVFGLYFWREYRVQQRELQSASAPHRAGQRYIGQVLTLTELFPAPQAGLSKCSLHYVNGRLWSLERCECPRQHHITDDDAWSGTRNGNPVQTIIEFALRLH